MSARKVPRDILRKACSVGALGGDLGGAKAIVSLSNYDLSDILCRVDTRHPMVTGAKTSADIIVMKCSRCGA